ncbi:Uncharacterized protein BM_BM4660 [Brugia malayi]|uniref:BMA-MBOA-2 n=1 Tax=Brugia malayi TaxID=6279 RepID=A0A0K0JFM3_BRUMA|nr:Uncharacterized protein BM_BM4660 [Brugia malayi]CRZ24366.1 BMA-MBOA-2 [Brugia malayi]VIO98457.1 Uncharacterized protein BM_BM4660 [Brugia malayi]
MPQDSFHCCVINDGAGRWFVYFDKPRSVMTVTDSMTSTYEKAMTTKDQIEFAGNVSESLLEQSWQEMILRRTLKVSEVTDDKLILVHVVNRIELNRVINADMQLRTVDLLERAVNAYLSLLERQIRNRTDVEQMAARKTMRNQSSQRKKSEKHENGSTSESSKRRRTRPTGLNFDD